MCLYDRGSPADECYLKEGLNNSSGDMGCSPGRRCDSFVPRSAGEPPWTFPAGRSGSALRKCQSFGQSRCLSASQSGCCCCCESFSHYQKPPGEGLLLRYGLQCLGPQTAWQGTAWQQISQAAQKNRQSRSNQSGLVQCRATEPTWHCQHVSS